MKNSEEGFYNIKACSPQESKIILGDGNSLVAKFEGSVDVKFQVSGKTSKLTLTNVLYVPDLVTNLFLLEVILEKFWFEMSKHKIHVKQDEKLIIELPVKTLKDSSMKVLEFETIPSAERAIVAQGQSISVNVAHELFGHGNEELTCRTAQAYGWNLKGKCKFVRPVVKLKENRKMFLRLRRKGQKFLEKDCIWICQVSVSLGVDPSNGCS